MFFGHPQPKALAHHLLGEQITKTIKTTSFLIPGGCSETFFFAKKKSKKVFANLYSMHKLPQCTHQFFLLFPRKFHRKQSYFHWILQMITMLSGILCHNRCWQQYPTPWHASMWLQSRNKMFVPLSSRILLEMQHVSLIFCSENKCRFFGKALFDWISLPCKTVLRTLLFGEPFFSCQLQLQIIVIKTTIVYFTNGLTEYCKLRWN